MTGFAAADTVAEPFRLSWELRSVNHRFLDASFRLPEELKRLEPALRDRLGQVVNRGKVDCTLRVVLVDDEATDSQVDRTLLASLHKIQTELQSEFYDARPMSIAELLRWPGLLREPRQEITVLEGPATAAFGDALTGLYEARHREGSRIAEVLEQRRVAIVELIATLKPLLPAAQQRHRDKLLERLARLGSDVEPTRIEQELALILQRLDVHEEVDRLESHMTEIADILLRDEPIGRRLDFLIQELNREANTLASKSSDEQMTRLAIDLKVLVEQMREQVQNLE
jgi:uncharacterized protein (TIGR00255 family)